MIKPVAWTNKWYVKNGRDFRHIEAMPCQHPSFDIPLYAIPPGFAIVPVVQVKDAERYRWLRDIGDSTWEPMGARVPEGSAGIDAAIDKAMLTAAKGE